MSIEERFWDKVEKTSDCWLWKGKKERNGYGRFKCKGKMQNAHRLSWLLSGKTIPDKYVIRHKCRNKHCVNPDHLETGTNAENSADMIRDGTSLRGSKNPSVKLNEEQVREIRARENEKGVDLAKEFGVTKSAISMIILRRSWNWLTD